MADHDDALTSGLLISGVNLTTDFRCRIQGSEEVRIDFCRADSFHPIVHTKVIDRLLEVGHLRKGMVLAFQISEIRIGWPKDAYRKINMRKGSKYVNQPTRFAIRQGTDENRVHQTEDCRTSRYSQSKRNDGHE